MCDCVSWLAERGAALCPVAVEQRDATLAEWRLTAALSGCLSKDTVHPRGQTNARLRFE